MTNKEDAKNLGYLEVNLFDEMDQGSLSEYMDMEPTVNMDESQDLEALTNRLEAMGMWEVMDLPPGMNTVDTKWVLEVKTDANLVPTKFKARLMARGAKHSHEEDQAQGAGTATRRTKLKEQAQPRRGPSSRSMQMVTTQGLERQEPKELSLIKGGGAVSKESTPGHEEEEQCRRSRHSSRGTGVPSRRGP
ncbi:hypothetical protein NDA17_000462 [Ustilago hordei]|nr:hypothetical protein NDA17_000462 [Ustilago hordei]